MMCLCCLCHVELLSAAGEAPGMPAQHMCAVQLLPWALKSANSAGGLAVAAKFLLPPLQQHNRCLIGSV